MTGRFSPNVLDGSTVRQDCVLPTNKLHILLSNGPRPIQLLRAPSPRLLRGTLTTTPPARPHLLRYLAGYADFSITYKEGEFKLAAFTDANWGENPDNRKATSSYTIMLYNGPISFKVAIQQLNAQSTMEAELVAVALTMKESVFCNMELGFKEGFGSVPLQIGSTPALHVTGSRTYSPRAKHIALRYFFVQYFGPVFAPPDLCLSMCKEFIVHGTISYVVFQTIVITTVL